MPVMYAVGRRKVFRTLEEGTKAGYYPSYNDLAAAKRREKYGDPEPQADLYDLVEEAAAVMDANPGAVEEAIKSESAVTSMPTEQVRELGKQLGIEDADSMHHMTLRKQVEERLNAQSGSD